MQPAHAVRIPAREDMNQSSRLGSSKLNQQPPQQHETTGSEQHGLCSARGAICTTRCQKLHSTPINSTAAQSQLQHGTAPARGVSTALMPGQAGHARPIFKRKAAILEGACFQLGLQAYPQF